jgi:hypothetical protein
VVHRNESPVGDNTSDADCVGVARCRGWAGDEVLDSCGVEQLDVGELQDLGQQGRCKESGMLNDDKVTFILVRHTNLVQEELCRLAHDHGAEELTTEPGTTTGGNASFDNGNLEVGTLGGECVSGRKTARTRTDDDDVRLRVGVKILEVAAGHGTRHLRLADRGEGELLPVVLELSNGLGLAGGGSLDSEVLLGAHVVDGNGGFVDGGRGRHVGRDSRVEAYDLLSLFHTGRDRAEHDPFRRYYPDQVRNRIISERIQQDATTTLA